MEKFIKEKHSTYKITQCAVAIFLLNIALGWVNKNYLGSKLMLETLRAIPRPPNVEFHFEYFWHILGHSIFAMYFSLYFSRIFNGKGVLEGFKIGSLVGFFLVGFMFIEWPFLHFEHHDTHMFFSQLVYFLLLPCFDGMLASLIYKKN